VFHRTPWGRPPGGPIPISAGAALVALLLALVAPGIALGHGPGGPWLAAEPYQVNPGGTVEIRGDNLGADEEVAISLMTGGTATDLGVGTTDGEGHLVAFVAIPADLPAAPYGLMGRTASGSIARGTITVAGPPIGESDGGNQLERGPIGVVPSVGAALASSNGAVGGQAAQGAPTSVGATGGATDALFLLGGLVVAVALVGVPLARRSRRDRAEREMYQD
jgi:hypothetical protein